VSGTVIGVTRARLPPAWVGAVLAGCVSSVDPGPPQTLAESTSSAASAADAPARESGSSGSASSTGTHEGSSGTSTSGATSSGATSSGSFPGDTDDASGSTGDGEETVLPGPPFELIAMVAPHDVVLGAYGPGQAWADVDGDGLLDLLAAAGTLPTRIMINQGDGSFAPWAHDGALAALTNVGGVSLIDYDNDGDADVFVLRPGPNALLRNDAGVGLVDVTVEAGVGGEPFGHGISAAWGDYDGDGWLDLYVANTMLEPDILYHNEGDGTFTDVSPLVAPGPYQTFGATWLDYDDDGDPDLYLVIDKQEGNELWRNDGEGCGGWCFVEVAAEVGADHQICGMGVAVGDYDGDLDLDLSFTDYDAHHLLRNEQSAGQDAFTDVSVAAGVSARELGWGVFFFDYDLDGWLDLHVVNGSPIEGAHNRLHRNRGDGTFEDVSASCDCSELGSSFGTSYADYDEDGAVDFVVAVRDEGHHLLHNTARWPDRHWLTVDLRGGGPVNRDGVGARVWVTTTDGRTLMQEVKAGSSVASANMRRLHFGLGLAQVDEIAIRWPDGLLEHPAPPAVDQVWIHAYPG
jgi:hypothetical protein